MRIIRPNIPGTLATGATKVRTNGEDGWYQAGRHRPTGKARFISYADNTITDLLTGLTWPQNPALLPTHDFGEDDVRGCRDAMSWDEGIAYCNDLVYAGIGPFNAANTRRWNMKNAWRLPSIQELWSIVDCAWGCWYEALNFERLPETRRYWMSTTREPFTPTYAYWLLVGDWPDHNGGNLTIYFEKKTVVASRYIWPVTGGRLSGLP